jgi:hypothetical protein
MLGRPDFLAGGPIEAPDLDRNYALSPVACQLDFFGGCWVVEIILFVWAWRSWIEKIRVTIL